MSKCILQQIVETTPTAFWNDTCDEQTLRRAVSWGATGATSNPVLVLMCIKDAPQYWAGKVAEIQKKEKAFSEIEIAWELVRQLALKAMPVLKPAYDDSKGREGRLVVQVNPKYFTNPDKMVAQARKIHSWGENIAVKIPAVEAGFAAMEELIAEGISILSTVQYTVPQAIATAEACERGYKRAESAGLDTSKICSWAAIMVGRLDDHLRDEQKENNIPVNSEDIYHASIAVFKKSVNIYKQHQYRTRLMSAATRGSYHCMDFVGGDIVISLPPSWQEFINNTGEPIVVNAIDRPVPTEKIENLCKHFPDFTRAYEEDGMKVEEFVKFGSSRKTLRQFINGYEELLCFVRDCMLGGPEL